MTEQRHHFVFLNPCGCPFALTEQRSSVRTEDDAWDNVYDTRAEEREARRRGVHVVFVDHERYVRDYYEGMCLGSCTHGGAA